MLLNWLIIFIRMLIRVSTSVTTDEFGGYIITRPRASKLDNYLVDNFR